LNKFRRLAEYAQWAAEKRVRQNERMAQQFEAIVKHSNQVTAAAHNLVGQDATARRELIQAQEKIQQQSQTEPRASTISGGSSMPNERRLRRPAFGIRSLSRQ
jgi:GMP synthase-like glutamine amidotransferase